jgi:predicted DNA binding protein
MREFVFTVTFQEGTDELMDQFIDYPALRASSKTCFATDDSMWRVDHLFGPVDALERAETIFLDTEYCNECLDSPNCETTREYHVLDQRENSRTIYTRQRERQGCHSVPYLVATHLGDGALLAAERCGHRYRWTVLMPDDRSAGALYDAIEEKLRDGLSLELERIAERSDWSDRTLTLSRLPYEQREALETALEHGYYTTPREITTRELSDYLDVPRSTLQYRLRRAEATVIEQFVTDSP